eukprot:8886451-Alexandrium_andersonii.AAC.1
MHSDRLDVWSAAARAGAPAIVTDVVAFAACCRAVAIAVLAVLAVAAVRVLTRPRLEHQRSGFLGFPVAVQATSRGPGSASSSP